MDALAIKELVLRRHQSRFGHPYAMSLTWWKPDRKTLRSLRAHDNTPHLRGDQVAVYVIIAPDDTVLYVGQTAHPVARINSHRSAGVRFWLGCRVAWFVTSTREAAKRAELWFVAHLHPLHNIALSQFQLSWTGSRGLTLDAIDALPIYPTAVA